MKKLFLLMSLILTLMPLMAAPGESLADPKTFDWVNGNEQPAGTTVFYAVDLSGVADGDNVLLYMNNLTDDEATVTVQAYLPNGTELTDGATTKVLSPRRNAAMELSHSLINLLGEKKTAYIKLTADKDIKFSAEPVEPGEKDLDCLSAKEFVWNGTTHNVGKTWYKIDLASVMANTAKTVQVTIKNQGAAAATVKGGISTDCPSTGTMDRTFTLGAGAENVYTLKRSQLNMLGTDLIYIRLESDQKLLLTASEVDALADDEVKAEDPIDFVLNTTYILGNNATQWYKVNVADLAALAQALEVFVENTSSATTTIDAHLQYAVISSDYMTRSITLSAGDKVSKEIARNLINTVHANTQIAYLRLKTTKAIAFSARTKGSACLDAEDFAIGTPKSHVANSDAKWYAIDITAVKADADNDLKVTITNNGSAAATVAAEFAFECPCTDVTSLTRTIAAGASLSKVLNNSMYSSLATNTIWVSVKSNQNLTILAEPVPAAPFEEIDACNSATPFELGKAYNVTAESWFAVNISDVLADPTKLPEVKVENKGTATASVLVEVAFACPVTSAMQSRTIKIAAGGEYVKAMTADMLKSLDPAITTAYVRVTPDQPITFQANLKLDPCETAISFDWNGTTHAVGAAWYKINLADVAPTNLVEVTVENVGTANATILGSLSLDCPSTGTTDRTITVNAGAQNVYTINRSQLNMLGANEIYIRVESNQDLLISAKEVAAPTTDITVENAIDFELETPYTVAANGSQWYKIDMNDVDQARQLLEVTIENNSAAATTINAVLQYKSTATAEEYMTRSLSLSGNQVYVKDIARNLIETVHGNTEVAYVRLETTEEITFSVRLKRFSEGTGCLKAKDFDKAGTYQAGSEEITWYAIDITAEKADAANDMEIIVENRSGATATVSAQIAFECPCDVTTDITRTLAAGATTSKKVLYSTYSTLATDTIWVGVTTDKNIMMSVRPVPVEDFDPITACDGAEHFKLDTLYTQTVDTAWYVGLLSEMLAEENKVPELTITNNGGTTANVKIEVAFECPVTSAMQSRTITIAAGATYTKKPTLDMLNSIDPTIDSVFVRIITDQEISAIATLKYENEGLSCATATTFDWVNGNDHAANDTVWYVVNITEAKAKNQGIEVKVENLSNEAATIRVDLSMDCPSTGLTTYNGTLGANATKTKTVMATGLGDSIYICVASNQLLHLSARLVDVPAEDEEGCLLAEELQWNRTYIHTAVDTVWYKTSVKELRDENTVPHLFLYNVDTKTIHVTAELTFDCAVATTTKTMTFSAGQEWEKLIEQNLIDGLDPNVDSAYVKLYGDGNFEFRVENQDPNQGQDCLHAIPFDWKHGNIHMEGDSLWYVIALKDTMQVETRDLRIEVENLDTTKPVDAQFTIVTDCKMAESDILLENETATLAAGATTSRTISNDILKPYAEIKIGLKTDADVHITAYFVDATRQEFFDTRTIYGNVCLGTDYSYKVDTVSLTHLISADRATWTWTDTVTFKLTEIELADSIVTFNLIPTQDPTIYFTDTATLADPVIMEGKKIDMSATTDDLVAKYEAARNAVDEPYRDTIDVVTGIGWEMQDPNDGKWSDIPTTFLPFETDEVTLRYYLMTICKPYGPRRDEGKESPSIVFNVAKGLYVDANMTKDTVCVDTDFAYGTGKTAKIMGDTILLDTIFIADYASDQQARQVDTFEVYVWKNLVLPEQLDTLIHPQVGQLLDITAADAILQDTLQKQVAADALVTRYTNATWEILDTITNTFGTLPTEALGACDSIYLRYVVDATCDLLFSDTLKIAVTSIARQDTTIVDTICAGLFDSRLQTDLEITVDTTFFDSIRVEITPNHWVDSIYNYDLKVWRALQLPDVANLITPQVGLPLDTTVADAALRADLDAQIAADDLVVAYTATIWEVKNADGVYEAIIPTQPVAEIEKLSLRYTVLTECVSQSKEFDVAVASILKQDTTIVDTLCVGTWFNSRLQKDLEITVDTTFVDSIRVTNEAGQVVDSIYNYTLYVWRELQLPDVANLITPQVGLPLDITAAANALTENLDEQLANPLTVAYTDVKWTIFNNGTDEAITAEPLDEITTITLHYAIETACGTQDTMLIVNITPILEQPVTITDTLCAGDTYLSRLQTLTIVKDTTFADTVRVANETGQVVDSIYNYALYVFVPITLPTNTTLTELPEAICGQPLHTDAAFATLMAELEALVQPINSTIDTLVWEIKTNEGYTDAALVDTVPALTDADLTVRYYVVTACNDTLYSEDILLTVAGPTADNTESLATMPAVSKYNDWLLMIDLNEINKLGFYPTEEEVEWYKIQGEADFAATVTSDPLDSIVGTGYYFTTGQQLNGEYYAVIDMLPDTLDACGAILRTVTLTCASTSAGVSIAPNIAAPGEDITINGLNPTLSYTLDIYNFAGMLVEHITISNVSTYTFKAQSLVGYYMLNVQTNEMATSLKYIVK